MLQNQIITEPSLSDTAVAITVNPRHAASSGASGINSVSVEPGYRTTLSDTAVVNSVHSGHLLTLSDQLLAYQAS